MGRTRKYGDVRAMDCKILAVRLPDSVIATLNARSGGTGASDLLTRLALTLAAGDGGHTDATKAKA